MNRSSVLTTVEQLVTVKNVKYIDATWCFPTSESQGVDAFKAGHIPSARHIDIDGWASSKHDLPHMMPSPQAFSRTLSQLGITRNDNVVVYDSTTSYMASTRLWYTFKYMGHNNVHILDGGLSSWKEANCMVTTEDEKAPVPSTYTAKVDAAFSLVSSKDIVARLENNPQIVDARSQGRFSGKEQEPWTFRYPLLRRGCIPNSKNVPFNVLLQQDGTFKDDDSLCQLLVQDTEFDTNKPIIVTCGSGVTAATLLAGYRILGVTNVSLYDGSWCEWGNDTKLPVVSVSK